MLLNIHRHDPAIDRLVPQHLALEQLATGFTWTEGPVWLPGGDVLFADITSNSIRHWRPDGSTSIFLQPSGYLGAEPFTGPEPGSNGMTMDAAGRLTVAGHGRRNVWRLEELEGREQLTVLADRFQGRQFNSPNDLVYHSDGSLYFTDPIYGLPTQRDDDPEKELPINGVYRLPGANKQKAGASPDNDRLELLVSDLGRPNGIAFSPDEKFLYVSNSEPEMFWMRYTLKADGSVTDGQRICDAGMYAFRGAPDGIKLDADGNIYAAGPGGLWIMDPNGKHLGTIEMPETVSNLAWGGEDRRTLYITATTSLYRMVLTVAGDMPHLTLAATGPSISSLIGTGSRK